MKCPQCGIELEDNTPICPKCGERLIVEEKTPDSKGKNIEMPKTNPVRKSVAKGITLAVVIVALVLAFVAFGLPAINNQLNPSGASGSSSTSSSADSQYVDQITPTDAAADNAEESSSLATISAKEITLTVSSKEKSVRVTFPRVKDAVNYRVAFWPAGSTEPMYEWTKGETSIVIKNLKVGTAYLFRVTAYSVKDGSWIRSKHSGIVGGWLQSATAKLKAGKQSLTATISPVESATSYELIYASSESGLASGKTVTVKVPNAASSSSKSKSSSKAKTSSSSKASSKSKSKASSKKTASANVSTTIAHLKSKTTYYVKVRPICSVDGVQCVGEYGTVSKVKIH